MVIQTSSSITCPLLPVKKAECKRESRYPSQAYRSITLGQHSRLSITGWTSGRRGTPILTRALLWHQHPIIRVLVYVARDTKRILAARRMRGCFPFSQVNSFHSRDNATSLHARQVFQLKVQSGLYLESFIFTAKGILLAQPLIWTQSNDRTSVQGFKKLHSRNSQFCNHMDLELLWRYGLWSLNWLKHFKFSSRPNALNIQPE